MRRIALITALFVIQTFAFGQEKTWHTDDHSFAINLNPIFPYFGNLFNNSEYNDLYLSSAGLIYRHQKSPNRAIRFSMNLSGGQNTRYNAINDPYMYSSKGIDVSFLLGKEYVLITGVGIKKPWRMYGGWQVGPGFGSTSRKYEFQSPPQYAYYRNTSYQNSSISAYAAGFLGAEYLITEHIFLGIEVNLGAYVSWFGEAKSEFERYAYDSNNNIVYIGTFQETTPRYVNYAISTDNPVILRGGIRF